MVGRTLGEAGRLCRAQGAQFLVVFVPSKDRIYLDRTRFAANAAPRRWRENDLPERLAAVVRREDPEAGFLDLTPVFRQRAARGEILYFLQDSHWSPLGHTAAAAAIAARLSSSSAPSEARSSSRSEASAAIVSAISRSRAASNRSRFPAADLTRDWRTRNAPSDSGGFPGRGPGVRRVGSVGTPRAR